MQKVDDKRFIPHHEVGEAEKGGRVTVEVRQA